MGAPPGLVAEGEESSTVITAETDKRIGKIGGADLMTAGFGMAVAMWALGYVGRLPGVQAPGPLLAAGFVAVLLGGGYLTGRHTARGWRGGAIAGLITATLNLLIVLSLVRSDQTAHAPFSMISVPVTLIVTALLTAGMAALGQTAGPRDDGANWTVRFAVVAASATVLLLVAGGLVTGREAGLSVPDWPQSFGTNMFLYPLARMTGNIYYEHTHRLYGALVGITTVTLAIHLWRTDGRRWLHALALLAVVAVIVQGVMGGLRVALADAGAGVQIAQLDNETGISATLRVAHGVFGQVFFGLMVLIAAATSSFWRRAAADGSLQEGADRSLTVTLVAALVAQLLLGALLRHLKIDPFLHLTAAGLVTLLALVAGMRAWALHGERLPPLRAAGIAVMSLVAIQVCLGVGALVAVTLSPAADPSTIDAVLSTAHQTNGAALLAAAVVLAAFSQAVPREAALAAP